MDSTNLILGFLFGIVGTGYFCFGKSQGRIVPLGAGVGLMALPMFLSNPIVCTIVCCATALLPWFIRD
jgi:hypothetical protein